MATTSSAKPILAQSQIDDLFVLPVLARSIAGRVCQIIQTSAPRLVVPRITSVPSAAWVGELQEIPTSDAAFDEVSIIPSKVAGLVPISAELKEDSAEDVLRLMGDRLVADTVYKIDQALFTTQPAPAPPGIADLPGVTTSTVADTTALLDEFVAVSAHASDRGASIAAWVVSPAIRTRLLQIKALTAGLAYLIDTTDADGNPMFAGAPILSTPLIPDGTVWAVPRDRIIFMVHPSQETDITASDAPLFGRDGWMVRSRLRAGFGCTDEAALTKITVTAP